MGQISHFGAGFGKKLVVLGASFDSPRLGSAGALSGKGSVDDF